jgi:hypothetical protein
MSTFAPLNFYALVTVRGQFLRPDVQAHLKEAPVGPFSNFVNPRDQDLKRAAEALRRKLDALLFPEGLPRPDERAEAGTHHGGAALMFACGRLRLPHLIRPFD